MIDSWFTRTVYYSHNTNEIPGHFPVGFCAMLSMISDAGTPVKSSSAEVFVTVTNINDNGPVFGQGSYSVSLKDNTTLGTMVLQVDASDIDSPVLTFSILSGNTESAFSMSGQSGTAPCWLFVFVENLY